jgi:predicted DNA-binding transcriptional regulator AlpA
MTIKLLRFRDLLERGIVKSWAQLRHLQERGFPVGRMISPNCRCWTEAEIDSWHQTCPIAGPAPRGAAKARRGRPRKAVAKSAATA